MATPVTITAAMPSPAGSSAASADPKTASRTIRMRGKPVVSAFSRSVFCSSCMPAHSACWPTTYGWTPSFTSPTPISSRRSFAAWSASSREPVTASGRRTRPSAARSPLAFAAAAAVSSMLSTFAAALSTRSTAADIAAASPPLLCSRTPSDSLLAPWKRLTALSTSAEPLPGASKPPPVRFSVCLDANGIESSSSTSQPMATSFRRRRTNAESRFIADCIRGLPVGPSAAIRSARSARAQP